MGPQYWQFNRWTKNLKFKHFEEGEQEKFTESWKITQDMEAPTSSQSVKPIVAGAAGSSADGVLTTASSVHTTTTNNAKDEAEAHTSTPQKQQRGQKRVGAAVVGSSKRVTGDAEGVKGSPVEQKELAKAERVCKAILMDHKNTLATSEGIILATDTQQAWGWLKTPNPLMEQLRSKVKSLKNAVTPMSSRLLLNGGDFSQMKKTMSKDDLYIAMNSVTNDLKEPIAKLVKFNKKLNDMQERYEDSE